MKKIIAAFVAFLCTVTSLNAKVKVAVEGGLNLSLYSYNVDAPLVFTTDRLIYSGNSIKPDYRVGLNFEIRLSDRLYFQPSVFYVKNRFERQGVSTMDSNYNYYWRVEDFDTVSVYESLHSAVLYTYLLYKTHKPGENRLQVGIGPFLGVNFSGSATSSRHADKNFLVFGNEYGSFKRTYFGASFLVGYELASGLFFRGTYDIDPLNLMPKHSQAEVKVYHSNIGLTAGYVLGRKTKTSKGR